MYFNSDLKRLARLRTNLKACLWYRSTFNKKNSPKSRRRDQHTANSQYLEIDVHLKLLVSQSKISGPRKFTLRHQYFEKYEVKNVRKMGSLFEPLFNFKGYFEISMFEIMRVYGTLNLNSSTVYGEI